MVPLGPFILSTAVEERLRGFGSTTYGEEGRGTKAGDHSCVRVE